jgi:hypothetical protein
LSISAQAQFRPEDWLISDGTGHDSLDEAPHASDNLRLEDQSIAGVDGAEEPGVSDGGQFEAGQWRVVGIGLGNGAGQLSRSLDE